MVYIFVTFNKVAVFFLVHKKIILAISHEAVSRQHICYSFPLPKVPAPDSVKIQEDQGELATPEDTHGKEVLVQADTNYT